MKNQVLIFVLIFVFFCSCSRNTKNKNTDLPNSDTVLAKKELFSFGKESNEPSNPNNPLPLNQLEKIFPKNILDLNLEKVNKGSFIQSGLKFNSVSAEYVSNNGLVLVYVYDYINFSNLPYHLRSLFELTPKEEIISIKDGVGRLTTDELSHSKTLDVIYLNRFHIKVEALHYPNFRENAIEIVNSLYLTFLSNSVKVNKNG